MSSYIPGSGLKKPLNQLSNPIQPQILKAPPRFVWTRKHWKTDNGTVMKQIEHIPQLQEAAVLFQSRDYNSQHAYGKFPKYTTFVNLEFRPPPIDRDDILPLSRIPRPVIMPRINPGSAFSSGGSTFSEQNMGISQVEKYLTDRVKPGEIRPTFFAPISMPEDNSILPDLETTLPSTSASAGFRFPSGGHTADLAADSRNDMSLQYKSKPVAASSRTTPLTSFNGFDARQNLEFDYNRPQIAVSAGKASKSLAGLTPVDLEFEYNRPQVSATSREHFAAVGLTPVDIELFDNRSSVSAGAGFNPKVISTLNNGMTSTDVLLEKKIEGGHRQISTPTHQAIYDQEDRGNSFSNARVVTDAKAALSYNNVAPTNTTYQSKNLGERDVFFRQKPGAIGAQHGIHTQGHVKRAGVDVAQVRLKGTNK